MPRYVIEMKREPTLCELCPCCDCGSFSAYCMLYVDSVSGIRGRPIPEGEGLNHPRPSWCPLQPLDEPMDDAKRDGVMNITRHFVMLQPHGTYVFDTVECPHCKECRTIDADYRTMFCPSCGGALDAEPNVVERHHWGLYPSQPKKDVGRVVQSSSSLE